VVGGVLASLIVQMLFIAVTGDEPVKNVKHQRGA